MYLAQVACTKSPNHLDPREFLLRIAIAVSKNEQVTGHWIFLK